MIRPRVAFAALAVALAGACSHDGSPPIEPPPVVFPGVPVEMQPPSGFAFLVQVDSLWRTPDPKDGFSCTTTDSTVVAVLDPGCAVETRATTGTASVVVHRYAATTTIPITVVARSTIALVGAGQSSIVLGTPPLAYATGWDYGNNEALLWRINLTTLQADSALRVRAPSGGAVAINSTNTVVYVPGFGGGYVPPPGHQPLAFVDPVTNMVTDTMIGLTGTVYSSLLAPDDSTLYVGSDGHLALVNVKAKSVLLDSVESGRVLHLVLDATRGALYATLYTDHQYSGVDEFDAATLALRRQIVAPSAAAQGIALSGDATRLFVVTERGQVLSCSLGPTGSCPTATTLPELFIPVALNAAGTQLYAGSGNTVLAFDPATLQLQRAFVVGNGSAWRFATRSGYPHTVVVGNGLLLLP